MHSTRRLCAHRRTPKSTHTRSSVQAAVCRYLGGLLVALVFVVMSSLMTLGAPSPALGAPSPALGAPSAVPTAASASLAPAEVPAAADVSGDYVVWQGLGAGGDSDIFLRHVSAASTRVISDRPGDDIGPMIDGDVVVWEWHDGQDWEVMLYDVAAGRVRQLTDNGHDDRHPYIDGRWVVFVSSVPGTGSEIYLYNIESDTLSRVTANRAEDTAPRVQDGAPWSDGLLAWQRWDGRDWEIYYLKLGAPAPVQLTDNSYDDVAPSVGGGWIVWEGWADGASDIFAYNPYERRGSRQITGDPALDRAPRVEAGKLVWLKWDGTAAADLCTFDLRFLEAGQLTYEPQLRSTPELDLWRVAWSEALAGRQGQIRLQSLLGSQEVVLSEDWSEDCTAGVAPGLDGPTAVWLFRGEDSQTEGRGEAQVGMVQAEFPFHDVLVEHPYREAIESLNLMGVVNGRTETAFEPEGGLNRQQFAKMAVLAVGMPVSDADVCRFKDVQKTGAGILFPDNYVAAAHARGLVLGTSATTFAPYADVTRAQVITVVVRSADKFASGGLAWLPPDWTGATSWYIDPVHGANVHLAEANHLLDGIDLAAWNPDEPCSRGEAAQMVWNLWRRLAAPGNLVTAR